VRIFIAEKDKDLRVALQMLINQEAGMLVTGMAVETKGLVVQIAASEPDVLLLDWHLPGMPITDLLADLQALEGRPQIVVLSVRLDEESAAMTAGADAYISKTAPPEGLLALLRTKMMGADTKP
jgi:DNA-binding NarL/FixJ family response regulator